MRNEIRRGQVVLVSLDPVIGSEEGKTRLALIIQNNIGNELSSTTIVALITSNIYSKKFPTNVEIDGSNSPLKTKLTVLLNQIRTIDKKRIIRVCGLISARKLREVDEAIIDSLGL
ncbi:MAG: type II toxin-antitoxin system PemK/MazF family toxin [Candidatus Aenigmatarchaeota archaeon]